MTQANFDTDAAIQVLRDGKNLMGKGGVLTPLIKGTSKNRSNFFCHTNVLECRGAKS